MKKIITIIVAVVVIAGIGASWFFLTREEPLASEEPATPITTLSDSIESEDETPPMADTTTIIVDSEEYEVSLIPSDTLADILAMRPLDLELVRYAGHEYYAELPETPEMSEDTTSHSRAGHLYYWDGWNAFVINFEDYDIAPYQVVHLGEITDKEIVEYLRDAGNTINVKLDGGKNE